MATVVLVNPEIPPNTGNIGRLTLGTATRLTIVGQPSFQIDSDTAVQRAGLDYWESVDLERYPTWEDYLSQTDTSQRILVTKFSNRVYTNQRYNSDVHLIFGGENKGVPKKIHQSDEVTPVCIPMKQNIRAYNLANSTAIVLFEALRQTDNLTSGGTPYGNETPPTFPET